MKLENDLYLARSFEETQKLAHAKAVEAHDGTLEEREASKEEYMYQVERLRGDMKTVDAIVEIFLQELQGIDDQIREQVYRELGTVEDERFSKGAFRNVEQDQ